MQTHFHQKSGLRSCARVSPSQSATALFIAEVNLRRFAIHWLACAYSGGVLKGRLVTEAIKMQSVQSVLEDEAGNVMTVSVCHTLATCHLQCSFKLQRRSS